MRGRAYVEQFLAPALPPGDVVVLDISRRTRSPASAPLYRVIAAAGAAILYLPPYSPDLAAGSQYRPRWSVRSGAPIEQLSAKLKALLRKTRRAHQGRALAGDRPPPRRRAAKRVHPLP